MNGAAFNGRVGVIIEVAPNQFVQYVLKGVQGTIDVELADPEAISVSDLLSPIWATAPSLVTMHLTGYLASREEAERPAWVAPEPAGQLDAGQRVIES